MRLQHVTLEEMTGQSESRQDVALVGRCGRVEQEGRQLEQPVAIGLAGVARHGTPRARRQIDQIGVGAGGRAFAEIERKTELAQELELPAYEQRWPRAGIVERVDDVERGGIKLWM